MLKSQLESQIENDILLLLDGKTVEEVDEILQTVRRIVERTAVVQSDRFLSKNFKSGLDSVG